MKTSQRPARIYLFIWPCTDHPNVLAVAVSCWRYRNIFFDIVECSARSRARWPKRRGMKNVHSQKHKPIVITHELPDAGGPHRHHLKYMKIGQILFALIHSVLEHRLAGAVGRGSPWLCFSFISRSVLFLCFVFGFQKDAASLKFVIAMLTI